MRAKRFFYVCAGLFLLALGYHLGARNAGAQSPQPAFFGSSLNQDFYVVWQDGRCRWWNGTWQTFPSLPLPPGATIVGFTGQHVVASTGYVWRRTTGESWEGIGYYDIATPAEQSTFGGLKARYR